MTDIAPTFIDKNTADAVTAFKTLLSKRPLVMAEISDKVANIIYDIKHNGDPALLAYGKQFDYISYKVKLIDELMVVPQKKHFDSLSDAAQTALQVAKKRITTFHQKLFEHYQLGQDFSTTDDLAVKLGVRWSAIDAVGIYVPGGLAAYPSSVLMNAIPARVAGVKNIIMACPLGLVDSSHDENFAVEKILNQYVLAAAYLAGVSAVLCLGGAGAVAAFAYGTETIKAVDKIVGPGNDYVVEAKRQVFGKVGIDMMAGPSEILVLADNDTAIEQTIENKITWIAFDLISQAEHDPRAMAVLITDDKNLADGVVARVADILAEPSNDLDIIAKQKIATSAWQNYGAVVVVDDLKQQGAQLANIMAAEHVEVMTQQPEKLAGFIKHAGAIFLGGYSPEAFGDYLAGPSHVLPTFQSARFSSGLSIFDFMKRSSMVMGSNMAMDHLGDKIIEMANAEKLPHHAKSIAYRLLISQQAKK
ncbi:MAG: histidinol dehydrogenase [Alphaproteobacteria bacterium]